MTQRMRPAETEEGEQEDEPSEVWLSSGGGKKRTQLNSKPVEILKLVEVFFFKGISIPTFLMLLFIRSWNSGDPKKCVVSVSIPN